MVDADRNEGIAVYDNLIMHFPDWFLALSEKERARYQHHCYHWFNQFMYTWDRIRNDKPRKINGSSAEALEDRFDTLRMGYISQMKIQDASTKFLALSRHLLSYYPGAPKPAKDAPKK